MKRIEYEKKIESICITGLTVLQNKINKEISDNEDFELVFNSNNFYDKNELSELISYAISGMYFGTKIDEILEILKKDT